MAEQTNAPEKPLSEEQQWQLALVYLRRAEVSAHVLRGVLFFAAFAIAVFVLLQMKMGDVGRVFFVNMTSVAFSVATIFCLVKSWQLQKEKAVERFKYLKAKNHDAVAIYDNVTIQMQGLQSRFWDWLAFWALAVAILIQVAARAMGVAVLPAVLPSLPPLPTLPPLPL